MAKAVQSWLQTIRFDETYQSELKMAMAKLQPKRFYWCVAPLFLDDFSPSAVFQGENLSFPQIVVQREHSESVRQLFGERTKRISTEDQSSRRVAGFRRCAQTKTATLRR